MKLCEHFKFNAVTLSPMLDDDIQEMVDMINRAYSYQNQIKGEPRTNPAHLRNRASEVQLFVARSDIRIVGCVYLEPKDSALHFGLLTVADDFRGTGLAQAVMKAIEEYALATGFRTLDLDYMSIAPWLRKYYEGYGFRETGEVYKWGLIDLIRMRKEI